MLCIKHVLSLICVLSNAVLTLPLCSTSHGHITDMFYFDHEHTLQFIQTQSHTHTQRPAAVTTRAPHVDSSAAEYSPIKNVTF